HRQFAFHRGRQGKVPRRMEGTQALYPHCSPAPRVAGKRSARSGRAHVFSLTKLGGGSTTALFLLTYPAAKRELTSCGRIMLTMRHAAPKASAAIAAPST